MRIYLLVSLQEDRCSIIEIFPLLPATKIATFTVTLSSFYNKVASALGAKHVDRVFKSTNVYC